MIGVMPIVQPMPIYHHGGGMIPLLKTEILVFFVGCALSILFVLIGGVYGVIKDDIHDDTADYLLMTGCGILCVDMLYYIVCLIIELI